MSDPLTGTVVPDAEVEEWEDDEPEVDVRPDLDFTTTKKDRTGQEAETLPFKLDGEVYYAVKPPEAAFVYLSTAAARSTPTTEKMAAIISFIGEALTEESGVRIRDRLLDRDDDLEFTDLLPILRKLAKSWAKEEKKSAGRRPRRRR